MFLTATEWKELGGKREAAGRSSYRPLAFDSCALSLQPFETPVCTPEGVLFDILNLFPYVQKHKKSPITGEAMTAKEIVRLNMAKNNEGKWHCPVTFKEFTDHTHVVAVKPSGNVYAYEAVEELNIKRKNWTDLMTGEPFTRKDVRIFLGGREGRREGGREGGQGAGVRALFSLESSRESTTLPDKQNTYFLLFRPLPTHTYSLISLPPSLPPLPQIITLQDPSNATHMSLRDISNFKHLEEMRAEEAARVAGESTDQKIASTIRTNASTEMVIKEYQRQKRAREEEEAVKAAEAEAASVAAEGKEAEEEDELRKKGGGGATKKRRLILIQDLHPGKTITTGAAAASFTATGVDLATENSCRPASEEEIRLVRYKYARKLGKKGYVQLQTSLGNLNIEVHCDFVPRTAENFLGLCLRGFYDGLSFHRVIKGFMAQGGCPQGDGRGGATVWSLGGEGGREEGGFKDEFDSRLVHDKRGVLSMANSGRDSNRSQIFITFKGCRHLDNQHAIFGRVVGGMDVLKKIEEVEVGKEDRPKEKVRIWKALAFVNPFEESDKLFDSFIETQRIERLAKEAFQKNNNALGFTREKGKEGGREGGKEGGMVGRSAQEVAEAGRTGGFYSQPGPQASAGGGGVGKYLSGGGEGGGGGGGGGGREGGRSMTVLPQKVAAVGSEEAYRQQLQGPSPHPKESSKAFQQQAMEGGGGGGGKKKKETGNFEDFEGW